MITNLASMSVSLTYLGLGVDGGRFSRTVTHPDHQTFFVLHSTCIPAHPPGEHMLYSKTMVVNICQDTLALQTHFKQRQKIKE